MNYKENSFDMIRLGAALLIMISHYLVNLFGIENITFSKWLFAGSSLVAFFVLCGFFFDSIVKPGKWKGVHGKANNENLSIIFH